MRRHDRTWPTEVIAMTAGALAGILVSASVRTAPSSARAFEPEVPVEARRAVTVARPVEVAPPAEAAPPAGPPPAEHRLARLARGPADAVLPVGAEMSGPAVVRLLESIRNGADPRERTLAVILLATVDGSGDGILGALFVALATDEAPEVRSAIVATLRAYGDPLAADPLASAALYDTEVAIRVQAIDALGALRAVESIPSLITALQADPSPRVREAARRALERVTSG